MGTALDRSSPTLVEHSALQVAFDHFNATLFEGSLPPVLMSLQRHGKTFGYYHPRRFTCEGGERLPEIAMNPAYFGARSVLGTLSTVAHEICHHLQHTRPTGKVIGGYHDKAFSTLMFDIGLQTSSTGAPYGTPCGHSVSHYIIENGLFLRAAYDLLESGFELVWVDGDAPHEAIETIIAPALQELPKVGRQDRRDLRVASSLLRRLPASPLSGPDGDPLHDPFGDPVDDMGDDEGHGSIGGGEPGDIDRFGVAPEPSASHALALAAVAGASAIQTSSGEPGSVMALVAGAGSVTITRVGKNPGHVTQSMSGGGGGRSNRVKYRCAGCRHQIWGKPGIDALCRTCNAPFEAVTAPPVRGGRER